MAKITLRRYTQLAPLLHLLHRKCLTLLSPRTWDDKNDAYYLEVYRRRKNLGSVLALCFAEAAETYHHWHVFAGKSSGVCLEFEKDRLINSLCRTPGIKCDFVKYPLFRNLRVTHPATEELPFVKRYPFKDEREFRIICEDATPMLEAKDLPFDPRALLKVIINPWMPQSVFESVKRYLSAIDGWHHLAIGRTRLVDNDEWKSFADSEKQPSNQAKYPFNIGESYSREHVVGIVEEQIRRGRYRNSDAAWKWLEHIRNSPHETLVWTPFAKSFGCSPMNPNAWRTPTGEAIWKRERVAGG